MKTFFFREHPDFGMKIGVFSRLRPANSNNFEKWPTRVQKLLHPGIRQSNYRTGAPQASGMFHWGSAPPKRLKTTGLNEFLRNPNSFLCHCSATFSPPHIKCFCYTYDTSLCFNFHQKITS